MKYLKNLLTVIVMLSLTIFIGCQTDDGGDEPDPVGKETGEALAAGTWIPKEGGVTNDGNPRAEWDAFTLDFTVNADFTGGNYSTDGLPEEEDATLVWAQSGTWAFATNGDEIILDRVIRDDGVEISLIVDVVDGTSGTLNMSFEVVKPPARSEGFEGPWVFGMSL